MSSTSSEAPVYFKVSMIDLEGKQNEKRRFSLDRDTATKFDSFKSKLLTYFPTLKKGEDVKVFYNDSEGDNITVSSSDELNLAIQQSDNLLCKFEVHLVAEPLIENQSLHKGIKCNDCKKEIKGDRFKCIVCPDYDCCSGCEKASPHNHVMLKIIEPIKTMDVMLPCLCALLKAFFDDQNCNHKDCTTCHIRRGCSHSWREGTISQEYMGLIKAIDAGIGKCANCTPGANNNNPQKTSPVKAEPKTNGTSPLTKIVVAQTPPLVNGVKSAAEPFKVLKPVVNIPQYQVPMMRVVRPPMVMQPVCPPGMQSLMYTQGPPLQYMHNPYATLPPAPPMMYNPVMRPPPPPQPFTSYPLPPSAYSPAPQMNPHLINGNPVNLVNGNTINHLKSGALFTFEGSSVKTQFTSGKSVISHTVNNNQVGFVTEKQGSGHDSDERPQSVESEPEVAYETHKAIDDPSVSTSSPLESSSQDSPLSDGDDPIVLQRAILELSARGYSGEIKGLEDVLRSVDLNVEKACIMLNLF